MSSLYIDALEDLGGLYTCNMGLQPPSNFGVKKKKNLKNVMKQAKNRRKETVR